jgi:hypothetical protein
LSQVGRKTKKETERDDRETYTHKDREKRQAGRKTKKETQREHKETYTNIDKEKRQAGRKTFLSVNYGFSE